MPSDLKTHRVYLAGPHPLRAPVEWVADILREAGVTVVSTWHCPPHEELPVDHEAAVRAVDRTDREMDTATDFVLLAGPGCAESLCELGRWVESRSNKPIVIVRAMKELTATALAKARVHVPGDTTPTTVAAGVLRMLRTGRPVVIDEATAADSREAMSMFVTPTPELQTA
jgi:hypothetical protein